MHNVLTGSLVVFNRGVRPFEGVNLQYVLYSHYCGRAILPDIPECDDDLRDFILSCLRHNPAERASLEDLLAHPFLASAN